MVEQFKKFDSGKLSITLLEPFYIEELVKVMQYGANKYGRDNYKLCKEPQRYLDAAYRHIMAYQTGEMRDKESCLTHLSHAAVNLLFLLYLEKDRGNLEKNRQTNIEGIK